MVKYKGDSFEERLIT